jgi:hypothetical protein
MKDVPQNIVKNELQNVLRRSASRGEGEKEGACGRFTVWSFPTFRTRMLSCSHPSGIEKFAFLV